MTAESLITIILAATTIVISLLVCRGLAEVERSEDELYDDWRATDDRE
jgi:hypothetical protein